MACRAGDNSFDFDSMVLYSTGDLERILPCEAEYAMGLTEEERFRFDFLPQPGVYQ